MPENLEDRGIKVPLFDILMSTFNGERYLDSQISSILGQTYKNFRLLVRDDGSSDNTLSIIKKWKDLDSRIELLEDDLGNVGVARSFTELARKSKSKYACFSDQDDIWVETKLEKYIEDFVYINTDKPLLLQHDGISFKVGRGVIRKSTQITKPKNLEEFLFLNGGLYGCFMAFNQELLSKYIETYNCAVRQHDHHMSLCGLLYGRIHYCDYVSMFYRLHDKNVSGGAISLKSKVVRYLIDNRNKPVVDIGHYEGAISFLERDDISNKDRKVLEAYQRFLELGFFGQFISVFKNKFKIYNSRMLLVYKILARPRV